MNTKKLIFEKSEAEHVYRALVEANTLSCRMFAIAVNRTENEMVGHVDSVIVFEWRIRQDKPQVTVNMYPSQDFLRRGLQAPAIATEGYATQNDFAAAYGLG